MPVLHVRPNRNTNVAARTCRLSPLALEKSERLAVASAVRTSRWPRRLLQPLRIQLNHGVAPQRSAISVYYYFEVRSTDKTTHSFGSALTDLTRATTFERSHCDLGCVRGRGKGRPSHPYIARPGAPKRASMRLKNAGRSRTVNPTSGQQACDTTTRVSSSPWSPDRRLDAHAHQTWKSAAIPQPLWFNNPRSVGAETRRISRIGMLLVPPVGKTYLRIGADRRAVRVSG